MCGYSTNIIANIFCVFDDKTTIVGNLIAFHSPHQFCPVELFFLQVVNLHHLIKSQLYCFIKTIGQNENKCGHTFQNINILLQNGQS